MIRTVRTAGFAAAALALAAATMWGGPLQAEASGEAAFMSHGAAEVALVNLGLDAVAADAAADIVEASAEPAAAPARLATPAAAADRAIALVDAAMPRPRTVEELVAAYEATATADQEQDCLASAVYFEARGEPIEGQLAVADVVLNRVASKRYPNTICEVVEQPWQFSFVNATGRIPNANRGSASWRKSVAIARIAQADLGRRVGEDVLWYHADYVSPGWGRRLDRQDKVGLHIFYS